MDEVQQASSSGHFSTVKQDIDVRFEVFSAVAMKNAVFWDITPYGYCKNRRFCIYS
jgi:hypothetical protein